MWEWLAIGALGALMIFNLYAWAGLSASVGGLLKHRDAADRALVAIEGLVEVWARDLRERYDSLRWRLDGAELDILAVQRRFERLDKAEINILDLTGHVRSLEEHIEKLKDDILPGGGLGIGRRARGACPACGTKMAVCGDTPRKDPPCVVCPACARHERSDKWPPGALAYLGKLFSDL